VCNPPSVHIHPAIRPERSPAATVFVDIAVPSMYSYRRVRSPLEVNLTWTDTHLRSWVTCTLSMVRYGAMAMKPKESTRNDTLNDSCHTIPHSHQSTGDCRSMVHRRSTSTRWDIPPDLEEAVLDTIEEKPSSSTCTTMCDLSPMTLTYCCISHRTVTHKGSISGHVYIFTSFVM
jgi:hypothetical protein